MMGAPGAKPPPPAVPLDEQIAAVRAEADEQKKGKVNNPALAAAVATLEDYKAMQPKVLALSAAGLTLAGKCGMKEKDFDDLLVELEKHAEIQLEAAKKAAASKPTVLLVDGAERPAWPFRREPMP